TSKRPGTPVGRGMGRTTSVPGQIMLTRHPALPSIQTTQIISMFFGRGVTITFGRRATPAHGERQPNTLHGRQPPRHRPPQTSLHQLIFGRLGKEPEGMMALFTSHGLTRMALGCRLILSRGI